MILHEVSVGTYLTLKDADSDGFVLDDEDGNKIWLSYEQLDEVVHITDALRDINDAEEPTT